MTGHTSYTVRQAAYDLRKLRGKDLITKPGRTRRYHLEPRNAGTIAALLTLREQVIGPILAGIRSLRMGRKPITRTSVDRDYEKIRIDMQKPSSKTCASAPPDRQHHVDRSSVNA